MRDDDCLDAASSRLLIKKTWCHGQIIAAFQGVAYGYWGITADDLGTPARALLISAALLLPAWTAVSWWAMKGRETRHGRIILGFGIMLLLLYAFVLVIAAQDPGAPIHLAAIVFTSLQLVETFAYLVVVACLRDALVQDTSERQYTLM